LKNVQGQAFFDILPDGEEEAVRDDQQARPT